MTSNGTTLVRYADDEAGLVGGLTAAQYETIARGFADNMVSMIPAENDALEAALVTVAAYHVATRVARQAGMASVSAELAEIERAGMLAARNKLEGVVSVARHVLGRYSAERVRVEAERRVRDALARARGVSP